MKDRRRKRNASGMAPAHPHRSPTVRDQSVRSSGLDLGPSSFTIRMYCLRKRWPVLAVLAGVLLIGYRVHGYYLSVRGLPWENPPAPRTPRLPEPLAITFSADGRFVLTLEQSGEVRRWEARTGVPRGSRSANVSGCALVAGEFDATGRRLVAVDEARVTRLFRVSDGRPLLALPPDASDRLPRRFLAVAVSAGGRYVAHTVSGRVEVWDASLRKRRWRGPVALSGSHTLAVRGDGAAVALGTRQGVVLFFLPPGPLWSMALRGPWLVPPRIAFSRDGGRLAILTQSMTGDGCLYLADGRGRRARKVVVGADESPVLALTTDGRWLAVGISVPRPAVRPGLVPEPVYTSRELPLAWRWGRARPVRAPQPSEADLGHAGEIVALAWSSDGRALASLGEEGRIFLWDPFTGRRLREFVPQ
ncbi:MAG: hypothetical protein HY320_02305 [Armatimonadetes bacterium]|nr:hypothetical protein [Armatimonadota bacterium]